MPWCIAFEGDAHTSVDRTDELRTQSMGVGLQAFSASNAPLHLADSAWRLAIVAVLHYCRVHGWKE